MSVYIVVGTEESDVKFCEAYAGVQAALGRAFQIASDFAGHGRSDLIDTTPKEEQLSDCSVRWTFMNTNKHSVMVTYRAVETSMPSSRDPVASVPPMPVAVVPPPTPWVDRGFGALPPPPLPPVIPYIATSPGAFPPIHNPPPPPPYDFLDRSLPAGWTLDGKAITMAEMLDNPSNVLAPGSLTDVQRRALVIARIRKAPGWRVVPKGHPIPWFHRAALTQIERNTAMADLLIQAEIENLHGLHEDLVLGTLKIV